MGTNEASLGPNKRGMMGRKAGAWRASLCVSSSTERDDVRTGGGYEARDRVRSIVRRGRMSLGRNQRIEWPDGKDFAFTIFDDTDNATVERVGPVYDFRYGPGLGATKSVWPLKGEGAPAFSGSTCEDPDYLAWTLASRPRGSRSATTGPPMSRRRVNGSSQRSSGSVTSMVITHSRWPTTRAAPSRFIGVPTA